VYRPYKFQVIAVLQEHDDEGVVTGETVADPVIVFGVDKLREYADSFDESLAALNAQSE
jgi:hypothetical protein